MAKWKPSSNKDLRVYKNTGFLANSPSTADKLVSFLTRLLLITLWKSLGALSVPFGKLFAVYFWLGKSVVNISLFLEEQLLKAVGWLSGTAFGRHQHAGKLSRLYLGADVRRWHIGLAALVLGGLVHTVVRKVRDRFDERVKQARQLKTLMQGALNYEHWRGHAEELESLEVEQRTTQGAAVEHEEYDRKLLLAKTRHLKKIKATANPREIMFGLRIDLIRNIANIAKSQKQRQDFVTIPSPIQQYIREVQEQLFQICAWPEVELPLEEKLSFFKVTRHTFGRTALLLSGGGGLGTFHIGVCKSLFERQMLPRVLAGSSVGSIVCAIVGTRTDYELRETFSKLDRFDISFFQNSRAVDLVRHMLDKGHLQDISFMIKKLRQLLGDCTFLEAYERTGRILNVTVCPADTNEPPRLLNYLTAPQALIWSAVAASSSFPGLYPPQHIVGRNSRGEVVKLHAHGASDSLQRRWRDGSLEFDLPVQALGEMFNVNHFLVSQTNPHIVPLLNFKALFPHKWASIMEAELKHRLQVVQWMLPHWQVSKWLTLFTQPWEGDITFTLPSALWNLHKTIINPTTEDLLHAVKVGEIATWQRMAAIECNCTIEATLDKCVARVQNQARGRSMSTMGGKVPSWLHMPAVGVPSVHSWGDNIGDSDMNNVQSWGDLAAAERRNAAAADAQQPYAGAPGGFRASTSHLGLGLMGGAGARSRQSGLAAVADEGEEEEGSEEQQEGVDAMLAASAGGKAAQLVRGSLDSGGRGNGHTRLPPIPSSQSSMMGHDDDGFDSASSVAAGGNCRAAGINGGGSSAALGLGLLGTRTTSLRSSGDSGPLSRRNSIASGLAALGNVESESCRPATPALGSYFAGNGLPRSASQNRAFMAGSMGALSDPLATRVPTAAGSASSSSSAVSSAAAPAGRSRRASHANAGRVAEQAAVAGGAAAAAGAQRPMPDPRAPPVVPAAAKALFRSGSGSSLGMDSDSEDHADHYQKPPQPDPTYTHPANLSASPPEMWAAEALAEDGGAGTGAAAAPSSSAARKAQQAASGSARASAAGRSTAEITAEEIIALACMDCTDESAGGLGDLWGTLLPLAGTCETLEAVKAAAAVEGGAGAGAEASAQGGGKDGTLDVFAY